MGTLLQFLGSGAFGSLIGSIFAWLNRKEERLSRIAQMQHDEAMARLQNQQQLAMADKAREQVREAGEQAVASEEAKAFTTSQQAANAAISGSHWSDVINKVIRPIVTLYTLVLATMLAIQIAHLAGGLGSIDPKEIALMYAGVIDQIFFLTNLTVSWWFGARGSSPRSIRAFGNKPATT